MKRKGRRRRSAGFYQCPHCGEEVDTALDAGGGERQDYIEDCAVCCRPSRIVVWYSEDEGDYVVSAFAEI